MTEYAGREQEIEAREKAATKGPWYTELFTKTETRLQATIVSAERDDDHWRSGGRNIAEVGHWRDRVLPEGDAEFIAHAREDIPYLLAQLREARGKLAVVGQEFQVKAESAADCGGIAPKSRKAYWGALAEAYKEIADRILKRGE